MCGIWVLSSGGYVYLSIFNAGTWSLVHHQNLASGVSLNWKRAFKMQFRHVYFRSLVHPSQKLWPEADSGNIAPWAHVFCPLKLVVHRTQGRSDVWAKHLLIYQNVTETGWHFRKFQSFLWTSKWTLCIILSYFCELTSWKLFDMSPNTALAYFGADAK